MLQANGASHRAALAGFFTDPRHSARSTGGGAGVPPDGCFRHRHALRLGCDSGFRGTGRDRGGGSAGSGANPPLPSGGRQVRGRRSTASPGCERLATRRDRRICGRDDRGSGTPRSGGRRGRFTNVGAGGAGSNRGTGAGGSSGGATSISRPASRGSGIAGAVRRSGQNVVANPVGFGRCTGAGGRNHLQYPPKPHGG